MEQNNANDFNAGATDPSAGVSDLGNNGANNGQPSGDPGNQQGQNPDERDSKISQLTENVKALNKALVEARRNGNQPQRQNGQQNGNQEGQNDPNDPAYQYGVALKMATGDLRGRLESTLALYPELSEDDKNAIRQNPWGYVSENNMLSLNVDNSLLDIEEKIANYVEGLSAETTNGQPGGNPTTPATVNPNQPTNDQGNGQPDPNEDWNLPMDQLEQKVAGIKRSNATKS